MRVFTSWIFVLLITPFCFSQDPLPVLRSTWQRAIQPAPKIESSRHEPVRAVTNDNKYFQRKAREQRTDITVDPNEMTIDGRSAALEKVVEESRAPKLEDAKGFSYTAEVRNDSGKTVSVIYWEYFFAETGRPANVTRRQFLCGVKLKNGEKRELSVFSLLGPTDTIAFENLDKTADKLFTEEVFVNRIEFSDGSILQRADWKFSDVKASVERATSTPWGKETCRSL